MRGWLPLAPWLLAGLVVLVAGFVVGRALHPRSSAAYSFDASAPAYEPSKSIAGVDRAGLTGLSEDDSSRTVVSGHIMAFSAGSITLQSAEGVMSTLRLQPNAPLRQLVAADASSLRVGANVVVKLSPAGDEALAVLVLPAQ